MTGRQWVIAGGVIVLGGVIAMTALAASCAVMVSRQVDVRNDQTLDTFERESAVVLERLGGVPMLIEDSPTGPRLSASNLARRTALATRAPESLFVLVWAEDERKIVRLAVPFWLLRISPKGIDINVDDVDLRKLRLSVDDLERAGPGPLLLRDEGDSRVLVWTE